jgi:hypothetical protein
MSRATDDLLDALHALAASTLIEQVNLYRNAKDADGNPDPQPVPPALLAQVLKFLKDNGIDSPARAAEVKDTLKGTLPTFEDVQDAHGTIN